jgi:dsRNA-specific ribonuclease
VECRIPRLAIVTSGEGSNRRAAEQAAAEAANALAVAAERKGASNGR